MKPYFTVVIPYEHDDALRTTWHPLKTDLGTPFETLTRGAFNSADEAHTWAKEHLGNTKYEVRKIEIALAIGDMVLDQALKERDEAIKRAENAEREKQEAWLSGKAFAESAMERSYYEDINNLASGIKDDYDRGMFSNREHLIQQIGENVDGCARVIYTRKAKEAVLVSRNANAFKDAVDVQGLNWKNGFPWEQIAYYAVLADVYEALGDMDLEVNEDFKVCDKHGKPYTGHDCDQCFFEQEEKEAQEAKTDSDLE